MLRSFENSLNSPCNSNCTCSERNYFPVCGSNGVTYSSPCYAGCKTSEKEGEKVKSQWLPRKNV